MKIQRLVDLLPLVLVLGRGFLWEIQRGIVGVILLGDRGHFYILLFLGWDLLWGSLSGLKGAFYMQKVLI